MSMAEFTYSTVKTRANERRNQENVVVVGVKGQRVII